MEHIKASRKWGGLGRAAATGLLALGIAATGLGISSPAFADEGIMPASNADQPFDFNFYVYSADYSGADTKDDTTPTYMQVTDVGDVTDCYLNVQGSSDAVSWRNESTTGNVYFVVRTGQFVIHNYVYEDGYRFVRLGALRASSTGHMYGYWSGDSYAWANYESLN